MAATPSNPAPDNMGGFFVIYGVTPAHIDASTGLIGAALTQPIPAGMQLMFVPPGQSLPQTLPLWPTVLNQAASTATRSFDQSVATPTPAATQDVATEAVAVTQESSAANGEGGGSPLRRRELTRSTTPRHSLRLAAPSRGGQSVEPMTPLAMLVRRSEAARTPIWHATPASTASLSSKTAATPKSIIRTSPKYGKKRSTEGEGGASGPSIMSPRLQSAQGKKRSSEGDGGASGAIEKKLKGGAKSEADEAAEAEKIRGQILEWYVKNVAIGCRGDPAEMARMNEKAMNAIKKNQGKGDKK